ncbi:Scr1 family TA system antitoxin-like transcriptional regulator [Kitasatospora fiedleri]|uniref:Scr1 family TA system antitoxin-like transcriptional regulator n=1 Tax=Kitasatospora fiedleri TaxID=2991545 RepID=UPI00249A0573|nr:Scr1 family TA system antitoxin-like transcriptional regulator [Kitasatospora fiedleri]
MSADPFDSADSNENLEPISRAADQGAPEWSIPAAHLGRKLRALRGGRTLQWLKTRTHFSASKLSRIENGQRRLNNPEDVATILNAVGLLHGPDRAALMELAVAASQKNPPGFHRDSGAGAQQRLSGMVWRATLLIAVDVNVVSGALQTDRYMAAVTEETVLRSRLHEAPAAIEARKVRRRVVRESGVRAVFCMHQSALYRVMGSHELMVEQLEKLLEYTETPSIGVRIIPVELPLALQVMNLTLLHFDTPDAMPELIYVETGEREGHYYYPGEGDAAAFEDYKEVLNTVVARALHREPSRKLIRKAVAWHRARMRGGSAG